MRILHYALGLPPYRTGGLTKYVVDLMREQKRQGHEVAILWPGQMKLGNRKVSVRRKDKEFVSFELVNPLPVPLLQGVTDIPAYMAECDESVFTAFLSGWKPDVIEIHTFMGLYREFVNAAKKQGIPMVFVTHDYYTLCPKVNLLCSNGICEKGMEDRACSSCNAAGQPLSVKKIYLMQSGLYRMLKDSSLLKKMRKDYKKKQVSETVWTVEKEVTIRPYHELQKYYLDMLSSMDIVHANSSLAEEIYRRLGGIENTTVLTISNGQIGDFRKAKQEFYSSDKEVHLLYVGPAGIYKGFFFLTEVLDELWEEGIQNFRLHVYGIGTEKKPYLVFHEQFTKEQLKEIYAQADLTLVPSLWKETFGFVAAESLSYGTPVLVTEYVGAKDLVKDNKNGFCIKPDKASLKAVLKEYLEQESLRIELQQGVMDEKPPLSMEQHAKAVQQMLEGLIQERK